jgi:hypothetical protein
LTLALCRDFEAALNAPTKMFRPLNETHEANKGFRDFQHESDSKLWNGGLPDEESYHSLADPNG